TTMTPFMSAAEIHRARVRFHTDQEHALYVEYTEAMARIARPRYWRRRQRRFLRENGYDLPDDLAQDMHGSGG
ncbi:MAG: hypothetical protein AB7V44_21380, partial [Pseudonocardia sp.]